MPRLAKEVKMENHDEKPESGIEAGASRHSTPLPCSNPILSLEEALRSARHELATINGLYAFDGEAPEETFRINTMGVIAKIDKSFKLFSNDISL